MRNRAFALFPLAVFGCSNPANHAEVEGAQAPSLTLEDPAPASWYAAGPATASGTASALSEITVNGERAVLDGADFTAPVTMTRGINLFEARGIDDTGHALFVRHGVLAGDFADPSIPVDDALILRLNQGGLDHALDAVGAMFDEAAINDAIAGLDPIYEDSYGILGWNAVEVAADIGSISFDPPALQANPSTDLLALEVALPELSVWVPVSGAVLGWDFDVDAWIWAESAEVAGSLTLEVDDAGHLVAELNSAEVDLVGFGYDTSLLPGEIETFILVDTIRGALEDMILEKVEEAVPALLASQLSTLDLSFETEVLDKAVAIDALFSSAQIDEDGVQLGTQLNVTIPSSDRKRYAGYLSARGAAPTHERHADVGLTVSDDLLNRVLFEAWRGELLDLELSSETGDLDPILLTQLGATHAASVIVRADLPPVVVDRDGQLQAQIGELQVSILTPGGDYGNQLDLSVTIYVDLEIAILDGELVLELGDPEVLMMARDNDWNVSNETLTNLLAESLPIDLLLAMLGDFRFPLPTLGGLTLDRASVERDQSEIHSRVAIEMK